MNIQNQKTNNCPDKKSFCSPVKIGTWIFAVLAALYALILVFIPERLLWDTIIGSVAVTVAAAVWMLCRGEEIVRTFLQDRVRMWILISLSVLFTLMFSAEQLLLPENYEYASFVGNPGFGFGSFGYAYVRIMAVPLLLIASCVLISGFVYVMECRNRVAGIETGKAESAGNAAGILAEPCGQAYGETAYRKQKRTWMLMISLFAAAFVLAQYPFRPSPDASSMWDCG